MNAAKLLPDVHARAITFVIPSVGFCIVAVKSFGVAVISQIVAVAHERALTKIFVKVVLREVLAFVAGVHSRLSFWPHHTHKKDVVQNFFTCYTGGSINQLEGTVELKLTKNEAEKVLLEWAQANFPGMFNKVDLNTYSYDPTVKFTKEETEDAAQ